MGARGISKSLTLRAFAGGMRWHGARYGEGARRRRATRHH
jgi:hypothetical protein